MGRRARVDVPAELEHYKDRRRFLAIQAAKTTEDKLDIPHDFAELASLIRRDGHLVELPQLSTGYLLYGVGYEATNEFTHYDARRGKSVTLLANEQELDNEQARTSASRAELAALLRQLKRQLVEVGKGEAEARAALLAAIAVSENASENVKARRELISDFYDDATSRRTLFSEYETLRQLAADIGAHTYDVSQPDARKRLKMRMLSFVRPETRRAIEALAEAYQSRFKRRLMVTSLMRPQEYQRRLRESGNANAAEVEAPPHATGFAFDLYYGFMSAAEQQFVMDEIARMERAGTVEALRERRDHFHVFVFSDGRPPAEESVGKVNGVGKVKGKAAENNVKPLQKSTADKKKTQVKGKKRK